MPKEQFELGIPSGEAGAIIKQKPKEKSVKQQRNKNSGEAPKVRTEKELGSSNESINELIKEDKDLRLEFFKLSKKLEEEKKVPGKEENIRQRLKEINERCQPISKELDSKSNGFYSKIMDISVKKKKEMSEDTWKVITKKSGEILERAEEKLEKMKDINPSIKNYLKERIKQKREQLSATETAFSEPISKEETISDERPSEEQEKEKQEEVVLETNPELVPEGEKKEETPEATPEEEKEKAEATSETAPGEEKEKAVSSKEQVLAEARRKFAQADLEAGKQLRERNKAEKKLTKEDIEGYKEIKEEYLKALQGVRVELYEKAIEEIGGLGLPEKSADAKIKARIEEIIKETVVKEANNLYDLKTDLRLEAKGKDSQTEKIKKFAGRVVEKYRRMPTRYKLLISAGLLGGGVAAGAMGGATGAALATGLVVGRWTQRVLGGAATAVGLEALIHRQQEKRAEKKTIKEFSGKLKDILKQDNKSLDNKLFELEGSKKKQKYWRYAIAGSVGVFIASGLMGKVLNKTVGGIWRHFHEGRPGIPIPPSSASVEHHIPEASPHVSGIEVARSGDSVWKMAERQLSDRYGERFTSLDQAHKTYVIDALKDRVVSHAKELGLNNPDKIKPHQIINFSRFFEEKISGGEGFHGLQVPTETISDVPSTPYESIVHDHFDKVFEQANTLCQSQTENIIHNNQILGSWVHDHPGQSLTSEKVVDILSGKELGVVPNPSFPETVMPEPPSFEPLHPVVTGAGAESILVDIERAKELGFNLNEYQAIHNVKVEKLLEEIPSKNEAWELWKSGEGIDLPHHGSYGATEFGKHIKLSEFIRSFRPGQYAQKMTIGQFLKTLGPRELII